MPFLLLIANWILLFFCESEILCPEYGKLLSSKHSSGFQSKESFWHAFGLPKFVEKLIRDSAHRLPTWCEAMPLFHLFISVAIFIYLPAISNSIAFLRCKFWLLFILSWIDSYLLNCNHGFLAKQFDNVQWSRYNPQPCFQSVPFQLYSSLCGGKKPQNCSEPTYYHSNWL